MMYIKQSNSDLVIRNALDNIVTLLQNELIIQMFET